MTPREGTAATAPRAIRFLRRAGRVAWTLRALALFLLGPGVGLVLVGAIFGLPAGPRWLAGIAFAISASLFGMLAATEWRGGPSAGEHAPDGR